MQYCNWKKSGKIVPEGICFLFPQSMTERCNVSGYFTNKVGHVLTCGMKEILYQKVKDDLKKRNKKVNHAI